MGMRIVTQLEQQINFTDNSKEIANYILSHKDDVLHMSIQTLAKNTYTSTSAIMRLCNTLGLQGFKDFKIRFAQELNSSEVNGEVDPNFPFQKNSSIGEISNRLKKLMIQTLDETQQLVSNEDVKKACKLMNKANRTLIFGVGDAYLAGLTFQARMIRDGNTSFLSTSVYGEQLHLARTATRNDCAFILSYSGETIDTVRVAQLLKQNSVPIVCVTANGDSTLAHLSNIALQLPAREQKFHRIASFFSQTCMEYYLSIIYSYLRVLKEPNS